MLVTSKSLVSQSHEKTKPKAGAIEYLELFRAKKIPQFVVSDFAAKEKLQALGIEKYFEGMISCEEQGAFKPNPLGLKKVLEQTGTSADKLLHIGDRLDTDGLAAKNLGCRFALIEAGNNTLPKPMKL